MDPLTALTFNTWKCDGDYDARLPLMRDGIAALDPDILFLQEAFCIPGSDTDTARAITDALDAHLWFHPMRAKPRRFRGEDIFCQSGLAIVSRWPIEPLDTLDLPSTDEDGERAAQLAEIAVPDAGMLLVANTHLVPYLENEGIRARSAEIVMAEIRERLIGAGDRYAAAILGGDFNAVPAGPTFAAVSNAPGLVVDDAFGLDEGRPDTLAFVTKTASESRPEPSCVDYVFLIQRPANTPFAVTGTERVLDRADPATGLYPSDHFGVLMRIGAAPGL